MPDQDLMLPNYQAPFGSGVVGVCDVCGKRQAVIILEKERFKLCVLDFLNKSWLQTTAKPGVPLPPYRSERVWYDTEMVRSGKAPAIVLSPTKIVKHPTILVTPDIYGLTTTVLDAAIRFAREGFEVMVPDLANTPGVGFPDHLSTRFGAAFRGGVSMQSARVQRLVQLFRDALALLRTRPIVDPDKSAVFGVGYGGSFAIALAGEELKLTALGLAYPVPVRPPEFLTLLTSAVLLVSAGRDAGSRRLRAKFQEAAPGLAVTVEFADFPSARRNFLARDLGPYDLNAAEAAWKRTVDFFRARLLPAPIRPPAVPPRPAPSPPAAGTPPTAPTKAPTPAAPAPVVPPSPAPPPPSTGPGSPVPGSAGKLT